MKNTDILKRINALLSRKIELEQMTLENGTVVEADSFEVGAEIFAIDGENKKPLEIGDYVLADGTVITVSEVGKIGEIASPEAEKTEEEMKAELEAAELAKEEETNNLILKVAESFKPIFDEMNSKIESLSVANTELKAILSKVTEKKATVHKPVEKSMFSAVNTKQNLSSTEARIFAALTK